MAGGKGSAQKMRLTERRLLAVDLRKQGGTYREIAAAIIAHAAEEGLTIPKSYDFSQVRKDVMYVLRELNAQSAECGAEIKRLELARLNELHAAFWPAAIENDYAAFDRVLKVADHRAKLEGLYTPVKQQIETSEKPPVVGFDDALTKIWGAKPDEPSP